MKKYINHRGIATDVRGHIKKYCCSRALVRDRVFKGRVLTFSIYSDRAKCRWNFTIHRIITCCWWTCNLKSKIGIRNPFSVLISLVYECVKKGLVQSVFSQRNYAWSTVFTDIYWGKVWHAHTVLRSCRPNTHL